MHGAWVAGDLLRELRQERGLSQRRLAELAGVTQPTIVAIERGQREPSLSLLSRILEAGGSGLEIARVPVDRGSALATAKRVAWALGRSPAAREGQAGWEAGEDRALRAVIDLADGLRRAGAERYQALVKAPPDLIGDHRWDAFIAAVVEDESARKDVQPPRWVDDPRRFAKPFWYLSDLRTLHAWELATAPGAYLRHGVVAASAELESV